jgi:hypothetical protein
VNATNEEGTMSDEIDDERALLDRYAEVTSPSPSQIEHALTRTLARVEGSSRPPSLPNARRRFVWIAAAGFATLVFATAAFAGVRWLRARSQPVEPSYGDMRREHAEPEHAVHVPEPAPARGRIEPAPEPPELVPADAPQMLAPAEIEPVHVPRRRTEPKPPSPEPEAVEPAPVEPAPVEPAPVEPPAEASVLAEESRLLAHARRALHEDDFESALAWAEEHARRHPHGLLTEERLVLEAVAACRSGQRERGLEVASQLRAQYPNTPTLAKVEQSCQAQ